MKYFILIVFFFSSALTFAQSDSIAKRDIKVGLVLSGGGAKGLAHIGVLKEIEKAGIRVDYIGGTSMGAIIGALYASGYSAHQLDSIFNDLDFETLIRDDVPRRAKTFYEKEDAEKYALTFPFDDFQLRFPSAISKGQNVYNLLSRLLIHVKDVDDFNELPIPFLCIATDVEKGKQVILNKGYLPRMIAASGALPSLFSPVTINNTIYIDGGVVNNYPIDEVKAMGADIIIGVDVQDTLKGRDNLQSAIDVLLQINNYRTIESMTKKRGKTDVYINPGIDEFSVVSFDEGQQIIKAGEEAASKKESMLREIALQQNSKPKNGIPFSNSTSIYIDKVLVNGNKKYTSSYILGKLKLKTPSEVSYQDFSDGVNNLSTTGNFNGIDYSFVNNPEKKDHYFLHFDVKESNFKTSIRLAAHYDDLFKSAALINLTRKRLFTNNDIVSLDFIVGDNIRYNFNYYIDKGYYWSIGLNSRFSFFEKNVGLDFIEGEIEIPDNFQLNKIGLTYEDLTNQLFLQTVFRRVFQLGLGAEHKWLRYLSETIGVDENNNPRTIFENTNYFSVYGVLKYDTLDDKFFPTSGLFFDGDFHWYLFANGLNKAFEPFSIAKAKVGYAQSFSRRFSANIATEGGVKIGSTTTTSLDFFLGGYGYAPVNNLAPLYGYEALELRGNTYLKTIVNLDFEFARKNHLILSGNIANVGDNLFGNGDWIKEIQYSGIALGYGLETFLGPMEAKYAYSPEKGEDIWYFSAGFRF
ncbi:MAG: patatin-like phospholipase family protein [Flavobacteriaceae bacterium]|nr:patatin-like phospholipase family protein [Flavobacteriaceae bacterium]